MKKTTLIRKIDELGRLVLPKDVRAGLGIRKGDYLELSIGDDELRLKKYSCIRDIEYLMVMIVNSVRSVYGFESMLTDGNKVIISSSKQLDNRNGGCESPIIFEGNEIGKYIIYSDEEEAEKLATAITMFLRKYLEE